MANEVSHVDVTPIGPVSCVGVVWRMDGRLRVSVIVKASFALVPDGPMAPAPPDEIVRAEVHHHKNPMRSVRFTSDLAPFLARADVVMTGHAHALAAASGAASPEPVTAMQVRLAVLREVTGEGGATSYALLDKSIHVRGDAGPEGALPIERIPLTYERTYGGIGWEENPLGTGFGASEAQTPANLFDPADPARSVGFGPISRAWPRRKRLLAAGDRKGLDQPIAEVPSGVDWAYFQVAPADQRIEHLRGDEWIVLAGVHPTLPMVTSRLPFARGVARVYGLGDDGTGRLLPLVADTLRIEADELRCGVVWRGSFAIPDAAALGVIRILTGVEIGNRPLDWPVIAPAPAAAPSAAAGPQVDPRAAAPVDYSRTVALDQEPAPVEKPGSIEDVSEFLSTMNTEDDATPLSAPEAPAARPASIVAAPIAPPPIAPPPVAQPQQRWETTLSLENEALDSPVSLPFARSPRGEQAPRIATLPRSPRAPLEPSDEEESGHGTLVFADERTSPLAQQPSRAVLPFEGMAPPAVLRAPLPRGGAFEDEPPAPDAPRVMPARKRAPRSITSSGIQLFHEPALALAVEPWRLTPSRDCVTVIAKMTCDLVPGDAAAIRAEAEPITGDQHAGNDARRSLVHPGDLALFKARADVTLVGNAVAPGGSASQVDVLFRFGDPSGTGFERAILVFGERRWVKGLAGLKPSLPQPFYRIPVDHEHAFGGRAFEPNPIGIGHPGPHRRGDVRSPLPNLEDPDHLLRTPNQTPEPACFGPVPLAWKDRWAKLGWRREPWPLFPEDFDWSRYQAAPPRQQIPYLRGDEPFLIAGMSAPEPELAGSLPGVRVRCFVEGASFHELPLRLDTAAIDLDRRTLTLVWRGALGVPDESAPGIAAIHAVIERDLDGGPPAAELRDELIG